jgi:hypothetical protein
LEKLNSSYSQKENALEKSITAANNLTGELQSLKALQDNVKTGILTLSDTLENHSNELNQLKLYSQEFVKEAYIKLDDTLEYLKQKIGSTLEKESQAIEERVNNRIQYLEENLKKGDKILNSRHEKLQNEIKLLKKEILAIKEVSGLGNSNSLMNDKINFRFENIEDSMKELKALSDAIMQNIAILNSAESEEILADGSDQMSSESTEIFAGAKVHDVEVEELQTTMKKYASTIQEFQYLKQKSLSAEKRSGISMILSVFAILSILMILFLFLI